MKQILFFRIKNELFSFLGTVSIAEILIRNNAIVDAKNKDGNTPLQITATSGK